MQLPDDFGRRTQIDLFGTPYLIMIGIRSARIHINRAQCRRLFNRDPATARKRHTRLQRGCDVVFDILIIKQQARTIMTHQMPIIETTCA